MSLKGRLGGLLMKRIEAMPSVQAAMERKERLAPIEHAARHAAYGSLNDETTKTELAARITAAPTDVREATIELSQHRGDYVADRAYRLISAVAADGPVQPVPPERADLFAAEAELGRQPMAEAFRKLANIEPALLQLALQAESLSAVTLDSENFAEPYKALVRQLRRLVGGAAARDSELLRTNLASSIANQYIQCLSGDAAAGPATASFFEHPRKSFVASIAFKPRHSSHCSRGRAGRLAGEEHLHE